MIFTDKIIAWFGMELVLITDVILDRGISGVIFAVFDIVSDLLDASFAMIGYAGVRFAMVLRKCVWIMLRSSTF